MTKSNKRKLRATSAKRLLVQDVSNYNVPENCLQMRVKNGTKMRNVLRYALKHFAIYNSIMWSAVGQGISKGISCAEFFKRYYTDLNQITNLRYIS